jgi:hypothetical protein
MATAVAWSGAEGTGYAQLDYRLSAGSAVGVVENPTAQSNQASTRVDGIVSSTAQVDLSYAGRLTVERLGYAISAASYFQSIQSPTLIQILRLASEIQAAAETKITLGAGATLTRLSMVDTTAPADPQTAGPRPAGDAYFVGIDVGETLAWQLTGAWRVDQALGGNWFRRLGDALGSSGNESAALSVGVNHAWTSDSAGLRSRVGVITSGAASTQSAQPARTNATSEYGELGLSWRRDWRPDLFHTVSAGAFVLRTDKSTVLPGGSVSLLWHRTGYEIELRAGRTAESNIYIGTVYERDSVGLRVGMPIDRLDQLRVLASADVERDTIVGSSTGVGGSADVVFAGLAIHWQPGDMFVFGLDYTFRDQFAASYSGNSTLASFRRQTAMVSVGVQYPPIRTRR